MATADGCPSLSSQLPTPPLGYRRAVPVSYAWRGRFTNPELRDLHAGAFATGGDDSPLDWRRLTDKHSLGWVVARNEGTLVGFLNVLWDGSTHAWIQDVMVDQDLRRRGVGKVLVGIAGRRARSAGCRWLHVDFEDDLTPFYVDACGFRPTNGGLIELDR